MFNEKIHPDTGLLTSVWLSSLHGSWMKPFGRTHVQGTLVSAWSISLVMLRSCWIRALVS